MALHIHNRTSNTRPAFTLIELLVVIGILLTVAVVVIPSVRTLNKDRKVRDMARVVGAVFSAARERAAVDGWAGVEISSIANDSGTFNIPNGGFVLHQLRAIPPYAGDVAGATATIPEPVAVAATYVVTFIGADPTGADVEAGDFIEFNNSGVKFRIAAATATTVNIYMDWDQSSNTDGSPLPPTNVALPFKIHRQPKRVASSALRLPNNTFLNMAWSGFGDAPTTIPAEGNEYAGRQFRDFDTNPQVGHPDPMNYPAPEGSTIIWFAKDGSIDLVTSRGYHPGDTSLPPNYDRSFMERPTGPLYFLLCTGEGDDIDLTNLDSPNFVLDKNNIWISVHHKNGSVHVNRPAQASPVLTATNTERTQVQDSRVLVKKRRGSDP